MAIDLPSILAQILPGAIAWAELQSRHVAEVGQTLNPTGVGLAKSVGVQRPDLVRVKVVKQLPLPEEPTLTQVAIDTGLLGATTGGITLGYSILIIEGRVTPRLLSRE
jgi:hypothetical protein